MKDSRQRRFARLPVRLGLGLAAAGAAWLLSQTATMRSLEQRLYDLRLRYLSHRLPPSPRLVIVGIDDESLQRLESRYGRWPWPRRTLAEVIRYCGEARSIVLDILLPELDRADPGGDRELARAAREHGGVITAIYLTDGEGPDRWPDDLIRHSLPAPAELPRRILDRQTALTAYDELLRNSATAGFVNYLADGDGVLRGSAVVGKAGGRLYPSLALAAAMREGADPGPGVELEARALRVGPHRFPLDPYGRFLLCPSTDPHPTLPIADVLRSAELEARGETPPVARAWFRDKIVLVGSLATGLEGDRLVTSLSAYVPGISSVATALDNLLHGRRIRRPAAGWIAVLTLVAGLLPALPAWTRPREMPAQAVLALVLLGAGMAIAMRWGALIVPAVPPALALLLTYGALGGLHWMDEYGERRRLEDLEVAKQQFTDMLIHDLHNQIAPVLLTLSMIHRRPAGDGDHPASSRLIEGALANTRRLASLTGSLLDIRRMHHGRLPLQRDRVHPGEVFRNVASGHTASVDRPRLLIREPAGPERPLTLDRDLVERALANLVWNGLRHAARGTRVEMGWDGDENDGVVLWVANEGEPIPAAEQDSILQPFVTGSGVLRRELRGAGLGLAFCKLVAEAHGGFIRVESPWAGHAGGVRIEIHLPPEAVAAR